jgi:hypothetical protein
VNVAISKLFLVISNSSLEPSVIGTYLLDGKHLDIGRLDWHVGSVETVHHNDEFGRSIRNFDGGGHLIMEFPSLCKSIFLQY